MAEGNGYKLLSILQSHAPSNEAQEKCTKFYNQILKECPQDIELQMAGALFDGLSYGNWPWSK